VTLRRFRLACDPNATSPHKKSPIQEQILITNHSPVARHNMTGDHDGPNLGGGFGGWGRDRGRAQTDTRGPAPIL
jgi:hypothetical protein